jgi:hypothetical protein
MMKTVLRKSRFFASLRMTEVEGVPLPEVLSYH